MAEEHVVVPRDRYKRLMEQLSMKHTQDEAYQEPSLSHVETQSKDQEPEKNNTSFDASIDSPDTSDETFKLPEDTDDVNTDIAVTYGPPGITPHRVTQLVKKPKKKHKKTTGATNVQQKLYKKASSLRKVVKSRGATVNPSAKIKGSNKNFTNIKKNWLKAK